MTTVARLTGGEQIAPSLKKAASLPITPYKAGSVPRAPVVSRLAGNARLRPAVAKFVDRLPGQLDAMENAWKTQDFKALTELAHWLKGAGGTVGFDVFTEPAKQLEVLAKAETEGGLNEVIGELRDLTSRIVRPAADDNNEAQAPTGAGKTARP
jgi:HPt (histidine-containing phosphotransfer) domain-containing protein